MVFGYTFGLYGQQFGSWADAGSDSDNSMRRADAVSDADDYSGGHSYADVCGHSLAYVFAYSYTHSAKLPSDVFLRTAATSMYAARFHGQNR